MPKYQQFFQLRLVESNPASQSVSTCSIGEISAPGEIEMGKSELTSAEVTCIDQIVAVSPNRSRQPLITIARI